MARRELSPGESIELDDAGSKTRIVFDGFTRSGEAIIYLEVADRVTVSGRIKDQRRHRRPLVRREGKVRLQKPAAEG